MATPIIPWIGGKRRLAARILPLFPAHTCYVEPFCGAAALYFMKAPAKALSSRQVFKWLQATPTEPLTDIHRAARFYYLQRSAFGGKVDGQTFGVASTAPPRLNLLRLEEDLSQAHLRLASTYIEHLHWADCIARYDRPATLVYCDPPYWSTTGYGVPFELAEYDRLAALAKTMAGKMIISVNDIPEMRQAFTGLQMERVELSYTVGGGRRSKAKFGELIIKNF